MLKAESIEGLGSFYLGRYVTPTSGETGETPLLYPSKHLMTHAVCLGMTGSGKTGLCISLLEEAAIDGIPAIAVDLKGDIANLGLTFPELRARDFEAWLPEHKEAQTQSRAERAAKAAELWRTGLGEWGQDGARIRRMREAVQFRLFTPGSDAGQRLAVLPPLSCPSAAVLEDTELAGQFAAATVLSLLDLVKLAAEPHEPAHILLVNLLLHAWQQGQSLKISELIGLIQSPPFDKLGILPLESCIPAAQRSELALRFNGVLATPAQAAALQGAPLDIQSLLYAPGGLPRLSVVSLAHLGGAQRMLFVTALLNQLNVWMRAQPGSTSLRALLYIDELFGYLPPVERPSSKRPLLTLLKQARAYGIGLVLATQNPADLDYKALSNAGTWFIGRLQTDRDKARVMEGLQGALAVADASFERAAMEKQLASLRKRVFVVHNVHHPPAATFHTRWALSYLRGPMTRDEITRLAAQHNSDPAGNEAATDAPISKLESSPGEHRPLARHPGLPEGLQQRYLSPTKVLSGEIQYRPALWGQTQLHFADARLNLDCWQPVALLNELRQEHDEVDWQNSHLYRETWPAVGRQAAEDARYQALPPALAEKKRLALLQRQLKVQLVRLGTLQLWRCRRMKMTSEIGEERAAFVARARQVARERRDEALTSLQDKYQLRFERARERIENAQLRIDREEAELSNAKTATALSVGTTVLGALLGGKIASRTNVRGAASAARSAGRVSRQAGDVKRARDKLAQAEERLQRLEQRFQADLDKLRQRHDPQSLEFTQKTLRPRKADIVLDEPTVAWVPWSSDGTRLLTL